MHNKYEVLGVVGEGAYGIVYKCKNKETNDFVAIKKFKETNDEIVRKTMRRELKMLQMLKHENVVDFQEVFKNKGNLFLVFEYVERNLLELIEEKPDGLRPSLIKNLIFQLCKAIRYLHDQNVIHRDIKPENLLINNNMQLKLCDFGFARKISMKSNENLTDYVATRWYRSPELLITNGYYGPEVDYWAIGCIMGELADGNPLFPGENETDQLHCIQKVLGNLPEDQIELFYKNPLYSGNKLLDIQKPESLERRYMGKLPKNAISFMKGLLELNPKKRLGGEKVFAHPYLACFAEDYKKSTMQNNNNINNNNNNNVSINSKDNSLSSQRVKKDSLKDVIPPASRDSAVKQQQQQQQQQPAPYTFNSTNQFTSSIVNLNNNNNNNVSVVDNNNSTIKASSMNNHVKEIPIIKKTINTTNINIINFNTYNNPNSNSHNASMIQQQINPNNNSNITHIDAANSENSARDVSPPKDIVVHNYNYNQSQPNIKPIPLPNNQPKKKKDKSMAMTMTNHFPSLYKQTFAKNPVLPSFTSRKSYEINKKENNTHNHSTTSDLPSTTSFNFNFNHNGNNNIINVNNNNFISEHYNLLQYAGYKTFYNKNNKHDIYGGYGINSNYNYINNNNNTNKGIKHKKNSHNKNTVIKEEEEYHFKPKKSRSLNQKQKVNKNNSMNNNYYEIGGSPQREMSNNGKYSNYYYNKSNSPYRNNNNNNTKAYYSGVNVNVNVYKDKTGQSGNNSGCYLPILNKNHNVYYSKFKKFNQMINNKQM